MKTNLFFSTSKLWLALVVLLTGYSVKPEAQNIKQDKEAIKPMDGYPASAESQVTLMNAFEQPFNNWAFRNATVFPSLMVPRGGDIFMFSEGEHTDIVNHKFSDTNDMTVMDALVGDDTDGIIIIKNGEIRYEKYFGDFKENNSHIWASSTKSLMSMLTGILVEEGLIDLNRTVESYLPEMKGSAFDGLTLQQVMNMVSAINYSEDYADLRPGTIHFEYFRRIGFVPAFDLMATDPLKDDTPRGILGFLPNLERHPNKTPGEQFEYHSPNVDIIGLIISRVTNQSLEEVISERIWQKLGTEHDAQMLTDAAFNPIATGGFMTTLRDFARFGYAILNDGMINGQQVFPKSFIDETISLSKEERLACERSVYRADPDGVMYDNQLRGYKNFWWIHDSDAKVFTARGVYGQGLYIDKENDVIIAHFGSASSASNSARPSNKTKMKAFEYIAKNLK